MSPEQDRPAAGAAQDQDPDGRILSPLPGEAGPPEVAAPPRARMARKDLLALALLLVSLVVACAVGLQRIMVGTARTPGDDGGTGRDRPAAASADPRKLDLPATPVTSGASAPATRVPAIEPTAEELAEPIGVRRTGAARPAATGPRPVLPEDAPVLLVSSRPGQLPAMSPGPQPLGPKDSSDASPATGDPRDPLDSTSRNLQAYQQQLQELLDKLTRSASLAANDSVPPAIPAPSGFAGPAPVGLLGGQLQRSATPKAMAAMLGKRSLTLPKGTSFTCALKTRVVTATSGMVGCMVQRHVYGDDGRVLLIERGSHLDGEYRVTSARPGMVRIPVLWTRVRTPHGVTVEIDSPATGQLGESGIDGHVDNRWGERIGAAMLLSLIDDSVKLIIQEQSKDRQGDTIVLPSTTANGSKLAEKVLDSTINIPPLVYQNQGGIVGIYVARDVDFSDVYELLPAGAGPAQP